MGMPPLMALLPSLTARGLTKMSSSPATLQLVRVAPYSAMLGYRNLLLTRIHGS